VPILYPFENTYSPLNPITKDLTKIGTNTCRIYGVIVHTLPFPSTYQYIHLLLNATSTVDRDNIAKGLVKYSKSVSYFDEVKSNTAISWYCSKQLNQNIPYDLKFKEQFK